MASMQRALLEAGASALRPGGSLTYSVCTISRREGEGVVSAVLADRDGLRADDLGSEWPSLADDREPRFLQLLCDRDRTDGFFIARIGRGDG
jgi:16S rRNA (cytosine967-C5)-methyltransferase